MRIAVAGAAGSEDADVRSPAAPAPYHFICDAADRAVEVIANPFDEHERGIGLRVADFLASKGSGWSLPGDSVLPLLPRWDVKV